MLFHVTLDHTPELFLIVASGSNPMPEVIARTLYQEYITTPLGVANPLYVVGGVHR